jgi:hypothetical protein
MSSIRTATTSRPSATARKTKGRLDGPLARTLRQDRPRRPASRRHVTSPRCLEPDLVESTSRRDRLAGLLDAPLAHRVRGQDRDQRPPAHRRRPGVGGLGPVAARVGEELCPLVDPPNSFGQPLSGGTWLRGAGDRHVTRSRRRPRQSRRRENDARFDLQERNAEQAGSDAGLDENSVRQAFPRIGNRRKRGRSCGPRGSRHDPCEAQEPALRSAPRSGRRANRASNR